MEIASAGSRWPLRWAAYAGLWLLLCSVFGSQLYLAGYVTPWPRAFAAEAVYWLSWWCLAPAVFWWCRRLRRLGLWVRAAGLLAGALVAVLVAPLIAHAIGLLQGSLQLCIGDCDPRPMLFSPPWFMQMVRVAGVNLPVYAGFVLAWHAATFYREARDRQIKAAQLELLLNQAQLEALRSQLNPHFLFNALHSLAELVHQDPEPRRTADRAAGRVAAAGARDLEASRAHARTGTRFHPRLSGDRTDAPRRTAARDWEVATDTLRLRVPSLVLQPLVENAIQHGIAASTAPGTLTIRTRRNGGFLHIEVGDTGPGCRYLRAA